MRYHVFLAMGLFFITACNAEQVSLDTKEAKQSYSVGHSIGTNLKSQNLEINPTWVATGLKDAISGKSQLPPEDIKKILGDFQQEQVKKQQEKFAKLSEANKKEGEAFLSKNKKAKGVVSLKSGLQYKVLSKGSGSVSPKKTNEVKVHYKGTLIDGTVFDSSYTRNEPVTFKLNQVIPGWTEGLQYMKVGDHWQLFVPSELGYGDHGAGGVIGPNATLVFEVKLLEIK